MTRTSTSEVLAMRMPLLSLLILVLSGSMLSTSCSTKVPATITRPPTAALDGEPAVFLVAVRQRESVQRSLEKAGVRVVESGVASYTLLVKIGSSRGTRECGSKSNISYSLSAHGSTVLGIKGRGWTGSCPDNMLDEMSALLAAQFANANRGR
jgi:hypothetical protein